MPRQKRPSFGWSMTDRGSTSYQHMPKKKFNRWRKERNRMAAESRQINRKGR